MSVGVNLMPTKKKLGVAERIGNSLWLLGISLVLCIAAVWQLFSGTDLLNLVSEKVNANFRKSGYKLIREAE